MSDPQVFGRAWPMVVAATARLTGDLDLAEDCAQEAVERALRGWDADVPERPTAWLITTARRIALDRLRRESALRRRLPLLVAPLDGDEGEQAPVDALRLMFVCCHPALSRDSQVVLTLRLVCGLDVGAVAEVTLSGPAAVARRITRAKEKIALARIPFAVPPDAELPARLDAVLTVVHLLYTRAHGLRDTDLAHRAVVLLRMLIRLLPAESEPQALLGLVVLSEARGPARTDADADLLLLADQDRARWDRRLIREGLARTTAALRTGPHGRFALQAAIAGLHATAATWEDTDWAQIVTTYDALLRVWPSPVVALNRVAARSRLADADLHALVGELDDLSPALPGYRYLFATRAHLLTRLDRIAEARDAYDRALSLATEPAERRDLARLRAAVGTSGQLRS